MVELMVVVLIIGILVAVALPMMLGAKTRAQDRAAQAYAKYAFNAEKVHFADTETYTSSDLTMRAIEPQLAYVDSDTPVASGVVYLHVHPIPNEILISVKSQSGTCFYLREANGGGASFASNTACGVADTQTFSASW